MLDLGDRCEQKGLEFRVTVIEDVLESKADLRSGIRIPSEPCVQANITGDVDSRQIADRLEARVEFHVAG